MIKSMIEQLPDEDVKLQLLEAFDRLLMKYARILNYEDAYPELRVFFLELLDRFTKKNIVFVSEGSAVRYISEAVKNKYIAMSRKQQLSRELCFSDLSENQQLYIEELMSTDEIMSTSLFLCMSKKLSDREKYILHLYYIDEYSIDEIANKLKVSRQAINQTKLRAISKLKSALIIDS